MASARHGYSACDEDNRFAFFEMGLLESNLTNLIHVVIANQIRNVTLHAVARVCTTQI